eukprot:scaffold122830_cov48-Phaeocystis_antarctica.AAC.2
MASASSSPVAGGASARCSASLTAPKCSRASRSRIPLAAPLSQGVRAAAGARASLCRGRRAGRDHHHLYHRRQRNHNPLANPIHALTPPKRLDTTALVAGRHPRTHAARARERAGGGEDARCADASALG